MLQTTLTYGSIPTLSYLSVISINDGAFHLKKTMTPHFILVVLTACFMENFASLNENDDQLKTMMARIEMLELKSEKYDRLIEENELLREKIKENDGRISELNTKVKNLEKRNEYITVESERFQTEIDKTLTQKNDKFNLVAAVKNTLQMNITESKPMDDLVIAKIWEKYVQKRIGKYKKYPNFTFTPLTLKTTGERQHIYIYIYMLTCSFTAITWLKIADTALNAIQSINQSIHVALLAKPLLLR